MKWDKIDILHMEIIITAIYVKTTNKKVFENCTLIATHELLNQMKKLDEYSYYLAYSEYKYLIDKTNYDYTNMIDAVIRLDHKRIEGYFSLWQKLIYSNNKQMANEYSQRLYSIISFIHKPESIGYDSDIYLPLIINFHLKSCSICKNTSELMTIAQKEYILNMSYSSFLFQVSIYIILVWKSNIKGIP